MRRILPLLILVVAMLAPLATAQDVQIMRVELEPDESQIAIPMRVQRAFQIEVRDTSEDDPGQRGLPGAIDFPHSIDFSYEIVAGSPVGWNIRKPPSIVTNPGDTQTIDLQVTPMPNVESRIIQINFTATIRHQTLDVPPSSASVLLVAETPGFASLTATAPSLGDPMSPREIREGTVIVRNNAVFPKMVRMDVEDAAACGLILVPSNAQAIPPQAELEMQFSVQAPFEKPIYLTSDCPIRVTVTDVNDPGVIAITSVGNTISGVYVDPVWIFWTVAAIVLIIIIVMLVARRKAIIEEEILGKPQKPWTIPVERVYLEHLEAKDPRAAYVVRHFLMEEEYQSALLWYRSYKEATKGSRAKERLVVQQEHKYQRVRKKWAKKVAVPMKTADKYEAKLQKKLDRRGRKGVKKERKKWKTLVAKLEDRAQAAHAKETTKWEKAAKKAEKKGQPVPEKPSYEAPDLPPEPGLDRVMLADHKWNKKAGRFRAKMVKKQGNLEVKAEKKEAKVLHKIRRKVERIARKLDDPEFAEEHPVLKGQAPSSD